MIDDMRQASRTYQKLSRLNVPGGYDAAATSAFCHFAYFDWPNEIGHVESNFGLGGAVQGGPVVLPCSALRLAAFALFNP